MSCRLSPPSRVSTISVSTCNGTESHYVSAGTEGSPVLLVHGFPETWWTLHKLIPLLQPAYPASSPSTSGGFGDSAPAEAGHDSATRLRQGRGCAIADLNLGPVHLTGQDISGPTTFRVAATHPDLVQSYTAIETGLPGFGLEMLADVTHGGAWHIGVLAAPWIPVDAALRTRARVPRRIRVPVP